MRLRLSLVSVLVLAFSSSALAVQIQVEGLQDSLAGAPAVNHCTLRKAIINANHDAAIYPQCQAGSGHDEIVFNLAGTVNFALVGIFEDGGVQGDLDITDDLTIIGNPGGTTINGAMLDRIFDIRGAGVEVTLTDLNLVNGYSLGQAGAINIQQATVHLNNVSISNCTVEGGDGGAIVNADGATLHMTNCLVTGNTAAHHAGAIVNEATANITNCTIVSNNSGFSNLTGGIRSVGTTNLRNTIVAGNEDGGELPNLDGTFNSLGYNLIGDLGTAAGNPTITATTGDQFGISFAALNLGPLQNNGGPVHSRALGAGSIAIDQGHSSGSTEDQRHFARPCDDAGIANASGGDGGDVGAFEVQTAGCGGGGPVAPNAANDAATVAEDSGANAINVLANDTDANGDTLTIIAVTQGAHGSVTHNGTTASYTPAANYFGSDSFTYTIDDGHGGTDTATVTVTITNVNDAPVAVANAYTINQDTVLNVAAPGVLANDSDIDGDVLQAVLCSGPAHGNVSLNGNGSFSYTPNAGFAGSDTFSYRAFDGIANSPCVAVTITVLDTQPPAITASVGVGTLWSPNNKLVDVGFSLSATDNGGGAVTTTVTVYSDEDDGATPDASGMLLLRAEREGSGDGRFYLIRITATDAANNTSAKCLTVLVPKSQSAADVASVTAQAAAAQSACSGAGLFVIGN